MVAYAVFLSILLGIVASAAFADRVYCYPIIRNGVLRAVRIYVCNTPRIDEDPCFPQGCIYDVHFYIRGSNCLFTHVIYLPKLWTEIPPKVPGPEFHAETPYPGTAAAPSNPILPGQCQRFVLGVSPRCLSPGDCFWFRWKTTGERHEFRQAGGARCCFPKPAGT